MSTFTRGVLAGCLFAAGASAQRAPVKLPPRPEAPPPKPFVYPSVVVDSLPNGLRFAVVENHELPMVAVRVGFAGTGPLGVSFLDPAGKQGAWGLMLATLREGTTSRSSTQISNELAELGTEMLSPIALAFTPPSFRSARSAWTPSLNLLADLLVNPTFPAEGFSRVQTATATSFDRLQPISHANRIMYSNAYGPLSPYAQFGTGASVRATSREDVIALQQKYLRPQNTILVVAGDVTLAEARAAIASAFGGWERGGTTVEAVAAEAPAPTPTTIYLKDSPGLAQTIISAGHTMPPRDHQDAAAIEALASVMGDLSVSAGSRIYTAFRTERGLSYSSRVELIGRPIPERTLINIALTVAPAATDTAVVLLQKVVRDLRDSRPATASELEFAKRSIIGRLPLEMERIDMVASSVLSMLRDRRPADYLNQSVGRIDRLTLAEVQAAGRYLDPDHLPIVVVGDRAKIEAPLRATGIPVVIVDK